MNKSDLLKKIGSNIVSIRKSKGINQSQLALMCYKDRQSLERVENGKVNPTIYYLYEIANALEIDVKKLLEIDPE